MWNMNGNGAAGRSEKRAESAGTRRKRLRGRAAWFAGIATVLVIVPVSFGTSLSPEYVLPVFGAVFGLYWLINWWTIRAMNKKLPSLSFPWIRAVVAVLGAFAVVYATVFWVFAADIEAARSSAGLPKWTMDIQDLQRQRDATQATVQRPVTAAADDREVMRLQRLVDDATKEANKARDEAVCELDGTCGTRVRGVGKAYYEKVARQVELERQVAKLSTELLAAKASSEDRLDRLAKEQDAARGQVTEIDVRLAGLRANPPARLDKYDAFKVFVNAKTAPFLVVSALALAVFLLIDWGAFRRALLGVYRGYVEEPSLVERLRDGEKIVLQGPSVKTIQEYQAEKDGE